MPFDFAQHSRHLESALHFFQLLRTQTQYGPATLTVVQPQPTRPSWLQALLGCRVPCHMRAIPITVPKIDTITIAVTNCCASSDSSIRITEAPYRRARIPSIPNRITRDTAKTRRKRRRPTLRAPLVRTNAVRGKGEQSQQPGGKCATGFHARPQPIEPPVRDESRQTRIADL